MEANHVWEFRLGFKSYEKVDNLLIFQIPYYKEIRKTIRSLPDEKRYRITNFT